MPNSKTQSKTSKQAKTPIHSVIRPIMQLRACIDRVSTAVLRKKMGFGVSQFRILYVLANKPEMTQKVIADFWDVTEASVSRQIGILIRQGLALKKAKNGIIITPKGKKALDMAMDETAEAFEKIFRDISDSDRKRAAELLEDFIEKIRSYAQFK
jgi:DNA-binding MarR family transcriptional regulator